MVTDAAQVVAPTSTPHVEPGTRSYVNIPNNYWTEAPTVRTSVTVLGQAIPLTWTPTGTTWDFGDGAGATGNGIAGAAPGAAGAVEHAYLRQGSYAIHDVHDLQPAPSCCPVREPRHRPHLAPEPAGHASGQRDPDARRRPRALIHPGEPRVRHCPRD